MLRIDLHDGFYLGPVQDGDQPAYMEHFRDKETTDNLLKIPYPYTQADADAWVKFRLEAALKQSHETSFALRRVDGFLVGGAGLILMSGYAANHRAELGYWVAKDYRNRGLATAAIRAMTEYAFQSLGLKRVEAFPFSSNAISRRVLKKAGFTREGFLKSYYLKNGVVLDAYIYAMVSPQASPL